MSSKRKLDEMLETESKRKLDEMLETDWRSKPIQETKHSLDSDEDDDDNGKAYDILDDEQIEGQEDGVAGFEGGIQITPFNMKEEMEEGHFDTDGMYHWKKDEKLIKDNWLENINWAKIHTKKEKDSELQDDDSNDLPSSAPKKFDDISVYKEMLPFMKPKETVSKTLRRLAGNKTVSTAERWKRKKAGIDSTKEEEESKERVSKLTELANKILQNLGNMDVYQESYEYILEKVEAASKKESAAKAPELDMYADDFDSKEKERLDTKESGMESKTEPAKPPEDSGDVTWEYKLEKESAEISGPHTSEQMLKWTEDGTFKSEVWVRKCGQNEFYSSRRIDFDLYI
ncbi:CD2 antigen cytoplasmic tail-binding protein 2 homolog [Macrosteles quadrilineatus]|uniref:CD2 antigen cytoplasmic tail-binding protein 2 homolog n=1 Tax=Macrosteles quadrilineatus TaxID=74068 RepID=UPI0023E30DDE|nr:CD2 antigen cytoplasmic tail-binding protein 2 homolog [Macrosteles quadrilineatus]